MALWEHGRLMGAVETRAGIFSGTDILRFAVRPEARGRVEPALVARSALAGGQRLAPRAGRAQRRSC